MKIEISSGSQSRRSRDNPITRHPRMRSPASNSPSRPAYEREIDRIEELSNHQLVKQPAIERLRKDFEDLQR